MTDRPVSIRGVLRDDLQTRALLVERPTEQLETLVHVMMHQGRHVEVVCHEGTLCGDPVLVAYVQDAIGRGSSVGLREDGSLVRVDAADSESLHRILRPLLEPGSIVIDDGSQRGSAAAEAPRGPAGSQVTA